MRQLWVGPALLFAFVALGTPALAESGLRLSWDHCAADGRVSNKAFACDTNTGSERLVLSFDPPEVVTDILGFQVTLHIRASDGVMPAWWQFAGGVGCRGSYLVSDISASAAGSCVYPFGAGFGSILAGIVADKAGPGSWRLIGTVGVASIDQLFAVAPGTEYFAFGFMLRHTSTVGTGSCGGCSTPMCIGFGSLWIETLQNSPELTVNVPGPNAGGGQETVTWQGAYVTSYVSHRVPVVDELSEYAFLGCDPDASTPTRRSTWGTVKSLYR